MVSSCLGAPNAGISSAGSDAGGKRVAQRRRIQRGPRKAQAVRQLRLAIHLLKSELAALDRMIAELERIVQLERQEPDSKRSARKQKSRRTIGDGRAP
jgi:uncharacterized protein (DUF342 family)